MSRVRSHRVRQHRLHRPWFHDRNIRGLPAPALRRLLVRALDEWDRMATRVTVAEVASRHALRGAAKSSSRFVAAVHRAQDAEARLAGLDTHPARLVRLAVRIRNLLAALQVARCPKCRARFCSSCRLPYQAGHRDRCRLDRALLETERTLHDR